MKHVVSRIALAVGAIGCLALGAVTASAEARSSSGALPKLKLVMTGKTITVDPTSDFVSGGVDVVSTIRVEKRGEPTLVRLKDHATFRQAFGAIQRHHGDINALRPYGSIVFDTERPRGTSSAQTRLLAGRYIALDTESQGRGVPPHSQVFRIRKAAHPASLPAPAAKVSAIEFSFRGPSVLHDGQLTRFGNDGWLVHMIIGLQARSKSAAETAARLLKAGEDRKVRRYITGFYGFAGPLSTGGFQQFKLQAPPGYYVLACFMDTQDGREHTQLGMERVIRIEGPSRGPHHSHAFTG